MRRCLRLSPWTCGCVQPLQTFIHSNDRAGLYGGGFKVRKAPLSVQLSSLSKGFSGVSRTHCRPCDRSREIQTGQSRGAAGFGRSRDVHPRETWTERAVQLTRFSLGLSMRQALDGASLHNNKSRYVCLTSKLSFRSRDSRCSLCLDMTFLL